MADRFVQGFSDGSAMTHVRDMNQDVTHNIKGRTIAVTQWGCGCCAIQETPEHAETAKRIVTALNLLDRVERGEVKLVTPEPVSRSMQKRLNVQKNRDMFTEVYKRPSR